MDILFEILKYTIPSIIVFITAYFIIKSFMQNEGNKRRMEYRTNNQRLIVPIKLQAYERIILFLERISPESLLMRTQVPGQTSKQLQQDLLNIVRAEFEHNLSQQIYVTPQAWEVVKNTKENIVKLINTCSDFVKCDGPSIELSKVILETLMKNEKKPTAIALEFIKAEVSQFLN